MYNINLITTITCKIEPNFIVNSIMRINYTQDKKEQDEIK
jgi:hypothetical protein